MCRKPCLLNHFLFSVRSWRVGVGVGREKWLLLIQNIEWGECISFPWYPIKLLLNAPLSMKWCLAKCHFSYNPPITIFIKIDEKHPTAWDSDFPSFREPTRKEKIPSEERLAKMPVARRCRHALSVTFGPVTNCSHLCPMDLSLLIFFIVLLLPPGSLGEK